MKTRIQALIISTSTLFLYPLFFGYIGCFINYLFIPLIWIICLFINLSFITYKSKGTSVVKRFILSITIFISFWQLSPILENQSEIIYFYLHKSKFNKIKNPMDLDESEYNIQKLDENYYFVDNTKVYVDNGFRAIAVNQMVDNTDGFFYWNGKSEIPSGFFDGNLVYKKKITDHWYRFSTR